MSGIAETIFAYKIWWYYVVLTFIQILKFLGQLSHVLLELDTLLLFIVVLRERLQVNFGYFLILTVELVQFKDGIGLTLGVRGVIAELISLSVFLDAHFVALLAKPKIETIAPVNSDEGPASRTWVGDLRLHFN